MSRRPADRLSVVLVLLCTFLGAAAQVLMKIGGNGLAGVSASQLVAEPALLMKNLPLLGGYSLYGLSTVLLVLSLRRGQLSVLYPIISLTYVWVLLLSVVIFHESLNPWKISGVLAIVTGVGVLGRDGRA
ncbi:MAG: 4-amino-4-deoxy-L-arabinose transferase [Acidobacteria bacterium]|nr:4-amino-4-deoxy-L-arabinose transferase [Acidobacteriota bacterium]